MTHARSANPFHPGRLFAVGDIHGRLDLLARLLDRLPMDTALDTVIFLGDYINRGPDSRGVIDLLLQWNKKAECVFLMGNHEQVLLEYADSGDPALLQLLRHMGVEATLRSYGDVPAAQLRDLSFLPPAHRDFMKNLRRSYRRDGHIFVHAGLHPDPPEGTDPESTTIRHLFLESPTNGPDKAVFGHTGFATPLVTADKIGLDTGADDGNLLTALELPSGVFHHA